MASETNAKTATRPSDASHGLHFSEDHALKIAGNVLYNWQPTLATREALTPQEVGELQRLFAHALLVSADEVAHQSSIVTINDVVDNEFKMDTEEGIQTLHLQTSVAEKRVETLVYFLKDIDKMFISMCSNFNEMLQSTTDEKVIERLIQLREAVMLSEEVVRRHIEHNARQ